MSRILITGGEGLLGRRLCKILSKQHEVISADINIPEKKNIYDVIDLDITDKEEVKNKFIDIMPDIVIHAAALTDVDFCELNHEKADLINVKGTENVVEACKKIEAKILFISTEFVFDGKKGPYDENAEPNPISYYGKTKKEAEDIIKDSNLKYLIVRTTVLFGEHLNKVSFVSFVVQQLKQGNQINVVKDQFTSPTLATDLANALSFLIDKDYFKSEIVNAVSPEVISRYEFARRIADVFGLNKDNINPINSDNLKNPAPRPKKAGMKIDKITKLGYKMMTLDKSLKKVKEELKKK